MDLIANFLGLSGKTQDVGLSEDQQKPRQAKSMPCSPRFMYSHRGKDEPQSAFPRTSLDQGGSLRPHGPRESFSTVASDVDDSSAFDSDSEVDTHHQHYQSNGSLVSRHLPDELSSRGQGDTVNREGRGFISPRRGTGGVISPQELDYYLGRDTPRSSRRQPSSPGAHELWGRSSSNGSYGRSRSPLMVSPRTAPPPSAATTPSFSSLMAVYQTLRRDHMDLQEEHQAVLVHNEQLKCSVSQLERALANVRSERPSVTTCAARRDEVADLKALNLDLWQEVREKSLLLDKLGNIDGKSQESLSFWTKRWPELAGIKQEEQHGSSARVEKKEGSERVRNGSSAVSDMRRELEAIRNNQHEEMARRQKLEEEVKALVALRRLPKGHSGLSQPCDK